MAMKCSQSKSNLVVVVMAFLVATTAGAVEISIIGATSATITEGRAFTIDLGLDNASLDSTPGVAGFLTGLAAAGADVTGGQFARENLSFVCVPGSGCFGGVDPVDNDHFNPDDLSENFDLGDDELLAINAVGNTFTSESGAIDLGVANDLINLTPSPIDATIHLIATVVGVHELTVEGTWSDGVGVFPLASSTFTLTVLPIPEPGTALLMGIGLAVLATAGRRRNEERWQ